MSNIMSVVIRTNDGVTRAVCDSLCGQRWIVTHLSLHDAVLVDDEPRRVEGSCAHCVWCGEAVAIPITCRIHDGKCPDFDISVTHHAQRAVTALLAKTGQDLLPPRAWQYLERSAEWLRATGRPIDAGVLTDLVHQVKVDWETP